MLVSPASARGAIAWAAQKRYGSAPRAGQGGSMRKPIFVLFIVLLAILAAMAAKNLLVQPPALRAQPAAGEFDARRAKARLAVVLGDQRPHPADTFADDQVRERIVSLLRGMGLKPIVRDQLACNELYKQRG